MGERGGVVVRATLPAMAAKKHPKRRSGTTIPYAERSARGQLSVLVRLSPSQVSWLAGQKLPDEGDATALKRLAGVPVDDKSS